VNVGEALAPPYDVIDAATQRALYEKSPYNVIRLEYPEQAAEPSVALMREWLNLGVLGQDPSASFYVHEQRFSVMGQDRSRFGLIAAVRLHRTEERIILPHEHTTPKPVEDRLNVLRVLQCNVSPIFGLFHDFDGDIASLERRSANRTPLVEATADGETHRLWDVGDTEFQNTLVRRFGDRVVYLADGHHRFQAASAYRDERERGGVGEFEQAWQFILMHLVSLEDPGLVVLPLHRLVKNNASEQVRSVAQAAGFSVEPVSLPQSDEAAARMVIDRLAATDEEGPTYCLLDQSGEASLLRARDERGMGGARSRPTLDVVLLHSLLLDRVLGAPEAATDRGELSYTPWAVEAIREVRSGRYPVALLQNPVPVARIAELAEQGKQMPPKSTYFYPKLPTGLVMKRADEGPL
jgi:uncharacterized protein (DUF1015 family)